MAHNGNALMATDAYVVHSLQYQNTLHYKHLIPTIVENPNNVSVMKHNLFIASCMRERVHPNPTSRLFCTLPRTASSYSLLRFPSLMYSPLIVNKTEQSTYARRGRNYYKCHTLEPCHRGCGVMRWLLGRVFEYSTTMPMSNQSYLALCKGVHSFYF